MAINGINWSVCRFMIGWTILSTACTSPITTLPILGDMDIQGPDTTYHQIPDFSFVDHRRDTITRTDLQGKVYVADFFFTKCPTICPKMAQQMLRLHDKYKAEPKFALLSHSIDPKYDTIPALSRYATKLGVSESPSWHFLAVPKDQLNHIAMNYLAALQEDSTSSEGFTHSGHFLLVDGNSHIRSFCDGTKPKEVDRLMKEIDFLLNENK